MKKSTVLLVVGGAAALGLGVLLVSRSASAQPKNVTLRAGCRYRATWQIKPAISTASMQTFLTAVNGGAIPGVQSIDMASTAESTEVTMVGTAESTHDVQPGSTGITLNGKTMTLQRVALLGCP